MISDKKLTAANNFKLNEREMDNSWTVPTMFSCAFRICVCMCYAIGTATLQVYNSVDLFPC